MPNVYIAPVNDIALGTAYSTELSILNISFLNSSSLTKFAILSRLATSLLYSNPVLALVNLSLFFGIKSDTNETVFITFKNVVK